MKNWDEESDYFLLDGGKAVFATQEIVLAILKAASDSTPGGRSPAHVQVKREDSAKSPLGRTAQVDVQEHGQACRECARLKPLLLSKR